MSMLKTTMSSQVNAANDTLGARVLDANEISDVKGNCGSKRVKPKARRSKSKKLFKSRKLAKSREKSSKSRNSTNFDAKDNEPSFLIPEAKAAINRLQLAFTKTPIF